MTLKHSLAARCAVGALALSSVFTLGACGIPTAVNATPTATPNVTTIVQKTSTAITSIKDATYNLKMNLSTDGSSIDATGNGTMTTSPKRLQMTLNLTLSGISATETLIEDDATGTTYTQGPGVPAGKWQKTSSGASLTGAADPTQISDLSSLANAKLAGTTTKNGQTVWHITGTETQDGATANVDAYIRQADYLPAEVDMTTTGTLAMTITMDFTKYNSGVTITLPPASAVVAG